MNMALTMFPFPLCSNIKISPFELRLCRSHGVRVLVGGENFLWGKWQSEGTVVVIAVIVVIVVI